MTPPFRLAGRPVGAPSGDGLLPAERALLGPAATDKRRAEFRAGRLAGRAALRLLLGEAGARAAILREPDGRPFAADPGSGAPLSPWISISHAGGRALAAAGPVRLGLDLVRIEPLGEAFAREAFAPGELAAWRRFLGEDGDGAVATAFAAKEAALKWLGCGLRLPLGALSVEPLRGAPRPGGRQIEAAVRWEHRTAVVAGWSFAGGEVRWVALWTAAGPYRFAPSR